MPFKIYKNIFSKSVAAQCSFVSYLLGEEPPWRKSGEKADAKTLDDKLLDVQNFGILQLAKKWHYFKVV
jgi:hypothetical protein